MENNSGEINANSNLLLESDKANMINPEKILTAQTKENYDLVEQSLRISELRLKLRELEKSDWKKVGTWTGMVAIIVAIMGIIGQGIVYQIKSAKAEQELDAVLLKKKNAQDSVRIAYLMINKASDSLKLIKEISNTEYANYQENKFNAERNLDSLKKLVVSISSKVSAIQSKQINKLIKNVNQNLNTTTESIVPVSAKAITTIPQNNTDPGVVKQPGPVDVPNDPQKGKWGLLSERNGRKMTADVTKISNKLYRVVIRVVSTDEKNPLTGKVIFHLHNTFTRQNPIVNVDGNEAVLTLRVYGSFTVGAETDNGTNKLELDLAEVPNVPQDFKDN